ncbi:hypothetical protein CUC43_25600 [Bacillus thuringiensis LM1212]|uniref:hypothetical protein n=1 Tax=Bacillus cereus group TaxID=86661 RepID=UPI0004211906|nr:MULTISPECIES: hypothetical protein [Bacillus cereus group]AXY09915.1 hypothetical protein CUC43_25600 [Bacillus thuringiensis LM1212]QDF22814.1 hypothetical protein FJR70_07170 [Bacillus tropicus]QUG96136.1 hypothetical protein HCM98_14860 [Bacillus tropicus]
MKNEETLRIVLRLQEIFARYEITPLDLAHMVSSYCEDFLAEDVEIEPETLEKYTNLQIDLDQYVWDLLTVLSDIQ